jgi:hypothetical protein
MRIGLGCLGEDRDGDPVGVKRSGGAGVCLEVDEQLDDLVFADAVVQSDSQLAAKRLVSPEGRGDGNRAAAIALSVSRLEGAIVSEVFIVSPDQCG